LLFLDDRLLASWKSSLPWSSEWTLSGRSSIRVTSASRYCHFL